MSNLALQVKDDIVAKIKNDQLVLPTLPEIALQVQEIAEDAAKKHSNYGITLL